MDHTSSIDVLFTGRPRTLIAGLGNIRLGDDGVGVHAVRYFQNCTPRTCLAAEIGTDLLCAVPLFQSYDRIVVFDAFQAGGKPGSVYTFRAEDILEKCARDSPRDTELARALGNLSAEMVIVAAEPDKMEWRIELSPAVEAAVPVMVREAHRIIAEWQTADARWERIGLLPPANSKRAKIRIAG